MAGTEAGRPRWIVTGADGFLGNTVVKALSARGDQVRAGIFGDLQPPALAGVDCERVRLDVTEPASVLAAFAGSAEQRTIVVHTAGIVSIADEVDDLLYRTNVGGTHNVIQACRATGVARLVHVSSVHAIAEPATGAIVETRCFDPDAVRGGYARTKAEASAAVLAAGDLDRVLVHPTGLIGPGDHGDSPVGRLFRDLIAGNLRAIIAGGNDFVDVRDVTAGILAAAERGGNGECYLLAGHQASIRELAEIVHELTGSRVPPTVPLALARLAEPFSVWLARRRGTRPIFTKYSLYVVQRNAPDSHAKATAELGYQPRPLRDTLADTIAWIETHPAGRALG